MKDLFLTIVGVIVLVIVGATVLGWIVEIIDALASFLSSYGLVLLLVCGVVLVSKR